jgi:polyhydroxybutyrate depolymerase
MRKKESNMKLTSKISYFMIKIHILCLIISLFVVLFACDNEEETQPQSFPEIVNGTITYQNNSRKYILHIPSSYDGTVDFPLVVFLHGGGGSAQTAVNFTNFNQVSKVENFLMVYPQAFFEASPNSFVWADGRGLAPDIQGVDDVGFIDNLVTSLKKEYKINAKKVYLCGFSNGSFLTQRIAFEKNTQFAAIGTIGGTIMKNLHDNGNPQRAIPQIFIFGTDDPLVPYNGGIVVGSNTLPIVGIEQAVNYWVLNNNCKTTLPVVDLPNSSNVDNSTVTVFEYTNGNCNNSKVKFYKINGGGHTWAGVKLPHLASFGETNLDIFASQEIWNFFKQFELCK